ncbi:MAG: ABC transporter permease subunit [Acidimicrobiales bacterium]|jgi:ABC-type Na+ efflux pump permease subunit
MKNLDLARVAAVVRKELLDYRRKRAIVVSMLIFPILFLVEPVIVIFVAPPSGSPASLDKAVILPLIYMLLIAVVTPSTLAAYSIVGERDQGTLEPLLTTPIRQQELVLGKAAAVMIPSVALAYSVYALFLICVALFAHHDISSAVFHDGPTLLALFLFAPLVAGWAVVVGLGVSVRASEVRVAQQLGMLASFPMIGVIVLLITGVIHPTFSSAIEFGVGLLLVDLLALRLVSRMFDRERLVTGTKAST